MQNGRVAEIKAKKNKKKVVVVTAYDYTMAKLLDDAGVDIIMVGDSLGMVCQGKKDTKSVTIEHMVYHTECVKRGVVQACIVSDMPAGIYADPEQALDAAQKLVAAGADAVKVEESPGALASIELLINKGIAVMGHVGLTPQTATSFAVQGKDEVAAAKIMRDAQAMTEAGIFSLVLECVPATLAEKVSAAVSVPTIGIGAGAMCDGQVLVCYDLLGMFQDFRPKFVRRFLEGGTAMTEAIKQFRVAVDEGSFPSEKESF